MALSYNKFFEILNHTRAKESSITLEESIDKKLNEFTSYSNKKKTQILKSQNGNIILVIQCRKPPHFNAGYKALFYLIVLSDLNLCYNR